MLSQKDMNEILIRMTSYEKTPYKSIINALQLQENNDNIPWLTTQRFKENLSLALEKFVNQPKSIYDSQQIDMMITDVIDETINEYDMTGWVEDNVIESLHRSIQKAFGI